MNLTFFQKKNQNKLELLADLLMVYTKIREDKKFI